MGKRPSHNIGKKKELRGQISKSSQINSFHYCLQLLYRKENFPLLGLFTQKKEMHKTNSHQMGYIDSCEEFKFIHEESDTSENLD
jgi:hypothetical protein